MIKLMIVEDEEILRNGLIKVGKWESYGIEICCEAKNGEEALDKLRTYAPDIILTDVRMPVMNGIETKMEALINRQLYTKYKSAPTKEEQEKARIEYLDRKGYRQDFRW